MPAPNLNPYPGGSGFVTWQVYLDDRRAGSERLARIENKLDRVLERQEALELAAAREDGQEVAEAAAEEAVSRSRRSRGEVLRDVCLCVLSAGLSVAGALTVIAITGGSS